MGSRGTAGDYCARPRPPDVLCVNCVGSRAIDEDTTAPGIITDLPGEASRLGGLFASLPAGSAPAAVRGPGRGRGGGATASARSRGDGGLGLDGVLTDGLQSTLECPTGIVPSGGQTGAMALAAAGALDGLLHNMVAQVRQLLQSAQGAAFI